MKTVVVGVGNSQRGDDAFGPRVIDALAADPPPGTALARCRGDMAELIDTIACADRAIIVDAMVSGGTPGQVMRLDATQPISAAEGRFATTHSINLADAIELARALGTLPGCVVLYGVEASGFEAGDELSPAVSAAVARVAAAIRQDCQ